MRLYQLPVLISAFILGTISIGVVYAWTGPSASPPGGNVAAPINVGTTDQVKDAGIGVNSIAVFGNAILNGVGRYFNFGSTAGSAGYGIRDNGGLLEFKNRGGSWASLQATVFNLCSGGACGGDGAGMSGWKVMYNTCSGATCPAGCPAGKKATGGGCALINGGGNLQDSYSGESGWTCDYNGSINTVRAQVYCVSI